MSNNFNNSDRSLNEAVNALSRAVEAIELRVDRIDQAILELTKKRKNYLLDAAARHIPAISPRVLDSLTVELPAFVTFAVQQTFESNRKFLGIFPTKGYEQALTLMQTRLASHLDQMRYGELRHIDEELSQLTSEKTALNSKSKETLELLDLLEKARQQNVPLPDEVASQVDKIATTARSGSLPDRAATIRAATSIPAPHFSSSTNRYSYSTGNDDSDLWIYLITDFPTSFRTLLFSAISDHRHNLDTSPSVSSNGAAADWNSPPTNQSDSAPATLDNGSSNALGDAAVVAGAAAIGAAIATDDSLGLFS